MFTCPLGVEAGQSQFLYLRIKTARKIWQATKLLMNHVNMQFVDASIFSSSELTHLAVHLIGDHSQATRLSERFPAEIAAYPTPNRKLV